MEVEAPRQHGSNTSPSSSPEFEFWMVGNPSFPPSNLLTADELFLDGVLLPLQLLSIPNSDRPEQVRSLPTTDPPAEPSPSPSSILYSSSSTSSSLSRRWKDLFKATPMEKKPCGKDPEKNLRKKDRKSGADLSININIWPFTRSQSAGGRLRSTGSVSGRKVSSAPCSRSNSRGESGAGRRWAASPGRGGVHLGRSSQVLQIRRAGAGPKEKGRMWTQPAPATGGGVGSGVRVLNLNVNSCIGYGEKESSRGDDSGGISGCERIVEGSGADGGVTSAFSLRALFSKKVH